MRELAPALSKRQQAAALQKPPAPAVTGDTAIAAALAAAQTRTGELPSGTLAQVLDAALQEHRRRLHRQAIREQAGSWETVFLG